ncbi:MAG: YigZ family protein [Bacteroidaceae bacterium]|nr:YigZ family protein [Bacteroidaceae bacterium]
MKKSENNVHIEKVTTPLPTREGQGGESAVYLTIKASSEGTYTEKRSKFLAFAFPVSTVEEVKGILADYQKKYYDARHVCYAYMLGAERTEFRANDNGEPSGTAGKPILGQINSNNLTNILILVVRYFGGIKLGTSGLIVAYRAAAAEAIDAAEIIEKTVDEDVSFSFDYIYMNDVMRIVKEEGPEMVSQGYESDCTMTLRIRRDLMPRLRSRLEKVDTLTFGH